MASINDFKLLSQKCLKYHSLLELELNENLNLSDDKQKERFGFYILMIETLCGIKDINEILSIITDDEFNRVVFKKSEEDFGVDAIYIDENEQYVNFFNFKYRNKFNPDRKQGLNESFLSSKLTNAVLNGNLKSISGKTKKLCEQVLEKINSNEIWKFRLYVISNENKEINVESVEIEQLKEMYDLETEAIGLEKITKLLSIRPQSIDATIHLTKDSLLPFSESSLSSSISYVLRISAPELLRITCDDKELRQNYNMEDYKALNNSEMDYNLLFDNVRGLIVNSKYNENLFKTLKQEPARFFMYNNGLTITATDIVSVDTNANKKLKIDIKDFQVVNGGQTLRTLHKFNQSDDKNITDYLSQVQLLLRVFKTPNDNDLRNKIAQYTNSQNAISNVDLKSLSRIQIQIEQFLDDHNIIYARKVGDTGLKPNKVYLHKISMEKFGQILFSVQGYPHKASNQKKQIFDKYYDQVFGKENFEINNSAKILNEYYNIKSIYENHENYSSSDQKIFYLLYLNTKLNESIEDKIEIFEKVLRNYRKDDEISDARKLINTKFKEVLDKKIGV